MKLYFIIIIIIIIITMGFSEFRSCASESRVGRPGLSVLMRCCSALSVLTVGDKYCYCWRSVVCVVVSFVTFSVVYVRSRLSSAIAPLVAASDMVGPL